MPEDQEYFSVTEVAKRYGVSSKTIHRWIEQEPSLFPGSRKLNPAAKNKNSPYRIPQSAIDHYESLIDATTS